MVDADRETLARLRLTPDEGLVLALAQGWMLAEDVAAGGRDVAAKRRTLEEHRAALVTMLELEFADPDALTGTPSAGPGAAVHGTPAGPDRTFATWARRLAARALTAGAGDRAVLLESRTTVEAAAEHVGDRRRGLLLLTELVTFRPWAGPVKWAAASRRRCLDDMARMLPSLTTDDACAAQHALDAVARRIRLTGRAWDGPVASDPSAAVALVAGDVVGPGRLAADRVVPAAVKLDLLARVTLREGDGPMSALVVARLEALVSDLEVRAGELIRAAEHARAQRDQARRERGRVPHQHTELDQVEPAELHRRLADTDRRRAEAQQALAALRAVLAGLAEDGITTTGLDGVGEGRAWATQS